MSAPAPSVFVFGATGYVGRAVVAEAARREQVARVVAHVRPDSSKKGAIEREFQALGDPVRVDTAPLTDEGIDGCFARHAPTHAFLCHGTTRKRARAEGLDDPYAAIDVGLTDLVLRAAQRCAPSPELGMRIVYLSSMGTSERARTRYLAARWRAEQLVRESGLPFTICRAPLLSGPDRDEPRAGETWARRIGDPLLGALGRVGFGRLRDRYRSMDAAEAAEGLVRSGFHYMTINRVVDSDELRRVGVYERERWTPASRRDTDRH